MWLKVIIVGGILAVGIVIGVVAGMIYAYRGFTKAIMKGLNW